MIAEYNDSDYKKAKKVNIVLYSYLDRNIFFKYKGNSMNIIKKLI